jgi:hypothetical protein
VADPVTTAQALSALHDELVAEKLGIPEVLVPILAAATSGLVSRDGVVLATADRAGELERRVSLLAELAAEILACFYEKGHPGKPCQRTGWVAETTLAAWRERLAELSVVEVPPDDPPVT